MALNLRKIGRKIEDLGGRVVAQINPLDQGRTFSNPNPVAPPRGQPAPSAFQQAVHSGASNFIGDTVIKPLGQFPIDASSQIYNRTVAPAFDLPKLGAGQTSFNPTVQNVANKVGATGSLHQTIGSGLQTGLTIGSGGLGSLAEGTAAKIIPATAPKIVGKLVPKVASNAIIGGGFNASAAAGQGATPQDIAKSGALGAGFGAALPVGSLAAKTVAKPIVKLVNNKVPLNSIGAAGKDISNSPSPLPKVALKNLPTPETTSNIPGQGSGRNLSILQKVSPDRLIRENVTRPIVKAAQKGLFNASISENPVVRNAAKVPQGFTREAGATPEILDARRRLFGQGELGKVEGADVRALSKGFDEASHNRVYASLDPEQAGKVGIKPESLTAEESAFRDTLKTKIDERTQGLAERGIITPEQANQPYLRRAYSIFEDAPEVKKAYDDSRKNFLGTLKGRKDIENKDLLDTAITDPGYLVGKNHAEYNQAIALHDYVKDIGGQGLVSDTARAGFSQLPKSKIFGENAGKYVPKTVADDITGFQYTSGAMNALNDLFSSYDRLGVRQAKKKILTVFNPGVRVGNQATNRLIFSQLGGINPVQFNKAMLGTKAMIKNRDPVYVEAVKQGLIGTDITKADFATNILKYTDENTAKKALNWFSKSYSQADDRARLAAFKINLERGYGVDEAARLTQRAFQDYNTVGFFFDLAAKTPLIGNAFVRFAGDANRIISNAFIDHPIRTLSTGVLWANLVNVMSKVSGESPEDKKTREDRFGAPKIPGTNISLTVQTPAGEVNLARFVPAYQLNEIGSAYRRLLPFQGNPADPQNFNDPLLGQVGQLIADEDFRGKSIKDPKNVIFDKQTYKDTGGQAGAKFTPNSKEDQKKNIAGFLGAGNIPLGREANAVYSAAKGGEDIFGKKRNVPQAVGRALGVKVEQFGAEQAKNQRDTNAFFEGNIKRTNDFLKANPDLKTAYYKFNNPTRDRETNTKVSDLVTPERWKLVGADKSGRLYDFLRSEAVSQNKENGKPMDPAFQLNDPARVKEVLELRSRPTGDDIEREEILRATSDWYRPFEKAESQYYKDNEAWFNKQKKSGNPATENPRVQAYRDVPHPDQSPLVQQYYQAKAQGDQVGKDFYKSHADQLSADFKGYKEARLKEINAKRAIEGFDPISQDTYNNVTFGYEDDERKVAKELYYKFKGSGRGYGDNNDPTANPYKYTIKPRASKAKKSTISIRAASKPKVASKGSKPKVTIKKSKV